MGLSEIDDSDTEPEEPEAPEEEQKSPEKEEKMTYEQAAQILGVDEDEEDEAVLRKAFRKQSLLHHPDKNPNDPTATARFQKIGQALEMLTRRARGCVEINQCVGCNSSLSHFPAMTRPSWLGRAVRNRHCHAIEQASRRWRGGRRDDSARTRRKI